MIRFDPAALAEIRARTDLVALAGRLGIKLQQQGREHVGLCPFHNERTPSFTIVPEKGFYHCFGCGAHGDVIRLLMHERDIAFTAAVELLSGETGISPWSADEELRRRVAAREKAERERAAAERAQSITDAIAIWRSCRCATGTLVEDYLVSRRIDPARFDGVPVTIRFHPALYLAREDYRPAMVAAVQDPSGRVTGVHRTYLRPDGKGKAEIERPKRMFGICWGGAVRLGPAAEHMRIGEGIETCASVAHALGSPLGIWAALSLGNIAGAGDDNFWGEDHPDRPGVRLPVTEPDFDRPGLILPSLCKRLTICEDADNKDPAAAEALYQRATARYEEDDIAVDRARPPAGMDFNDLLRAELHPSSALYSRGGA